MKYQNIQCKTALHKVQGKFPYKYDLNIYRGCAHECQYCFAYYSNKYLNSENYFHEVFIKENIAEVLDDELTKNKKKKVINIGGVCDSYQPIEADTKLMRKVLKVMIKHQMPIIISTKSTLLLRDLDLIKELASLTTVIIACTITMQKEEDRKIIEPNTATSDARFAMLKTFRENTNAIIGVHSMPIMPFINDDVESIEYLLQKTKEINAHYFLPGTLYLRGITKNVYFEMIQKNYPHLYQKYQTFFSYYFDTSPYKKHLYGDIINPLKKKYEINSNYMKFVPKEKNIEQLTLF